MTSTPYQQQHLKSLTGLRFLAALAVFVAHLPGRWPEFDFGTLPFGAAGVGFFYILSGFILTYVYGSRLNRESGDSQTAEVDFEVPASTRFSYQKFYLRRLARIWPLHLVTLLISLFFVIGIETFFNRPHPVGKLLVNGCLLQSWIPNYDWIYSLNGPAWSLSVEAFFYLIFPFLLLGGAKKFARQYLLIAAGTMVALFAINQFVPTGESGWVRLNAIVHTNPLMRLFEFATGIGCGFYYLNSKRRGWHFDPRNLARSQSERPQGPRKPSGSLDTFLELTAILALLFFFGMAYWLGMYSEDARYGIPQAFWYWFRFCGAAPVFALIVLIFSSTQGLFAKALSCRLMVYLGEISYSFYMIHMSVMLLLARQEWVDGWWVTMGVAAVSFVFSIFLASALFQLVELPSRQWIVGVSEGKGIRFVMTTTVSSVKDWVRTPWFVPLLALTVLSGWFVYQFQFNIRSQRQIDSIVQSTPAELKNVRFESDAILLGVRTRRSADGGLVLDMVWELKPGRRSERFIGLLDQEQQVIGRGDANRDLFGVVLDDDIVIDRVRLKPNQLEEVETVAVGFFDKERRFAIADRGPRGARNRQLHVWKSN
jgi:peptidoglycan/LPS O-acetylase OafA/YrhL